MKEQRENIELNYLVYSILHDKNYSLEDAINYNAEYLLELVDLIKNKIIGVFRNGAEENCSTNDINCYADNTVDYEYLLKLFAMCLRDRMKVIGSQRN